MLAVLLERHAGPEPVHLRSSKDAAASQLPTSRVSSACPGAGSTDQGLDSLLAEASAPSNGEHRRAAMHTAWRPWTNDERAEAAQEGGLFPALLKGLV